MLPSEELPAAVVYDHVASACDQIGEALAIEHARGAEGDPHKLLEALLTLWRLRWEVYFPGGEVVADYKRETREELAEKRVAKRAGGAS